MRRGEAVSNVAFQVRESSTCHAIQRREIFPRCVSHSRDGRSCI